MAHCVRHSLLALVVVAAPAMADADPAQLEEGKLLFQSAAAPACAICHTMQDAGATGGIGPDLDELKPDLDRVKKALEEGMGAMPSFADTLTEAQRDAVAAYVVHASGAGQ